MCRAHGVTRKQGRIGDIGGKLVFVPFTSSELDPELKRTLRAISSKNSEESEASDGCSNSLSDVSSSESDEEKDEKVAVEEKSKSKEKPEADNDVLVRIEEKTGDPNITSSCSSSGKTFTKNWYEKIKGSRIVILWKKDKTYYPGIVGRYDKRKRRVRILYETGPPLWVNLKDQQFEFADQRNELNDMNRVGKSGDCNPAERKRR